MKLVYSLILVLSLSSADSFAQAYSQLYEIDFCSRASAFPTDTTCLSQAPGTENSDCTMTEQGKPAHAYYLLPNGNHRWSFNRPGSEIRVPQVEWQPASWRWTDGRALNASSRGSVSCPAFGEDVATLGFRLRDELLMSLPAYTELAGDAVATVSAKVIFDCVKISDEPVCRDNGEFRTCFTPLIATPEAGLSLSLEAFVDSVWQPVAARGVMANQTDTAATWVLGGSVPKQTPLRVQLVSGDVTPGCMASIQLLVAQVKVATCIPDAARPGECLSGAR